MLEKWKKEQHKIKSNQIIYNFNQKVIYYFISLNLSDLGIKFFSLLLNVFSMCIVLDTFSNSIYV